MLLFVAINPVLAQVNDLSAKNRTRLQELRDNPVRCEQKRTGNHHCDPLETLDFLKCVLNYQQ